MSAPTPPVALKNHCSIIHDDVLYVYTPEAFLTLPLKEGGKWNREAYGVSVIGGLCVKGGLDGDSNKPALYIVGGTTNSTQSSYSGIQRYSLEDKSWLTINPVVPITQNRLYHGAAYMNASSAIVIYGGSQNGNTSPSSETFIMLMYPPYRVQAYPSIAPPTVKPYMFSWTEDRALMVGGSPTNQNMFTFSPGDGWRDLGLALPLPLPNSSVAQTAIFTLDDNSRILQTYRLDRTPVSIISYVLQNPGGQPASFGETVGESPTTSAPLHTPTGARLGKRNVFLNNYPTYNTSSGPQTTRSDFSIAQGRGGLVAFLGGDADNSVAFFNQSGNGWVQAAQILGQQPITTSTPTPTPTSNSSIISTTDSTLPTNTPGASKGSNKSQGLTLLGAILGGICGLAAISIIFLLWLRTIRKRKMREERHARRSEFPSDKRRSGGYSFEEGLQPLSRAGQPMGLSPVPSAVAVDEAGSTAMYGSRPSEKTLIRRVSSENNNKLKLDPQIGTGHGFGRDLFKREKSQLIISKPMLPDLGDYKDRPSIELGRATPAAPVVAPAIFPARKKSQRKTDEGWAKYFTGDRTDPKAPAYVQDVSSPPGTRGKGVTVRDSSGNPLLQRSVITSSPNFAHGPPGEQTRNLSTAQGIPARISRAESLSTNMSDYEEEPFDNAFSSGIPASVHETAWTPVGKTWAGPSQPLLSPPSTSKDTPQSSSSELTTDTSQSGMRSVIPHFPMPSTIRQVRPSGESISGPVNVQPPSATHAAPKSRRQPSAPHVEEVREYFNPGPGRDGSVTQNDMSWLNLGTPSTNR